MLVEKKNGYKTFLLSILVKLATCIHIFLKLKYIILFFYK